MKLIASNTFKGSNTEGQALTILAGASAFNALSSGIYSDKIRAFIRELCCNAYDAWTEKCRAVGLENASPIPFEIKLPNILDSEFYVRDFGTGMDHDYWEDELQEDIANPGTFNLVPVLKDYVAKHHATYFLSTKANDDGLIGGFGVGSKSPMTYTDLYVVENRKNGRKTVHHVYKEDAKPKITKKIDMVTDEPDGMTISFAIAEKDFTEVIAKAGKVLQHFPVAPKVVGASLPNLNYKSVRLSESFELLVNASIPVLVMGCVEYPINDFHPYVPKGFADALFKSGVGFRLTVPVGTVWPTLSRESLDMHDRTKLGLSRAFSKAEAEIEKAIEAIYNSDKTGFEKLKSLAEYAAVFGQTKFANNAKASFNALLLAKLECSYEGIPLPGGELPFDVSVCYSKKTLRPIDNGAYTVGSLVFKSFVTGGKSSPTCIWIADVSKFKSRLKAHFERTGFEPSGNSFVVQADLTNPDQAKALEAWLISIGSPPVRKISELAAIAPVPRVKLNGPTPLANLTLSCSLMRIEKSKLTGHGFDVYPGVTTKVDLDAGVPYLLSEGPRNRNFSSGLDSNVQYSYWDNSAISQIAEIAEAMGLPDSTWTKVYVIPKSMQKAMAALGSWPFEKPFLDALSNPVYRAKLAEKINHSASFQTSYSYQTPGHMTDIVDAYLYPNKTTPRSFESCLAGLADTKFLEFCLAIKAILSKDVTQPHLIKQVVALKSGGSRDLFKLVDWSFLNDMWHKAKIMEVLAEAYPLAKGLDAKNSHHVDYIKWCETQPHFQLPKVTSQIGKPLQLVSSTPSALAAGDTESLIALSQAA